jgi:hypothetical protein
VTQTPGSRFARALLAAPAVALTAFHLVLLAARVADGSVLDPAIAAEWVIGLTLLLGLARMHRAGLSLIRGRGALIMWLLVLILHAVAVVPADGGAFEFRVDLNLVAIIPVGVAIGVVASYLAGLSLVGSERPRVHLSLIGMRSGQEGVALSTDLLSALVPRAPPV